MASSLLTSHVSRFLCFALSASLSAACGSSDAQRASRDSDGAGGEGGAHNPDSGNDAAGAPDDGPNELGGAGGERPSESAGGAGGDSAGELGGGGSDTRAASLLGLRIEPAETELAVSLGQSKAADLDAFADFDDDSSEADAGGQWTTSDPELAGVDEDGNVTATGQRGGTVTIRYQRGKHEASASFHVSLTASIVEGTVGLDDGTKLDGGTLTASNGLAWEYPEDKTVFPARMQPPKFQWQAGDDAFFRLRFRRRDDVSITVYTSNLDYQPSPTVWNALGGNYGGGIDLELEGKQTLSAEAPRHAAGPRSITLADAELSGAIYSFETGSGLLRFDLPAAQQTKLFPQDQRCRSCHSPSRDGSLLSFQHDGGGANPGGIYSTASGSSLVGGTPPIWGYSTFSPDAQRLVASNNGALTLYDISAPSAPSAQAALAIEALLGTQPSWSPDGSTLAFIGRGASATASDWAFESSNLYTAVWDRQAQKFGKPALLSAGATAGGPRDTLTSPNWSPDSRFLVVGSGANSYVPASMALALVDVVGKTRTELSRASSSGINETPSFAPRAQGGFYWVVFTSNRAYGHSSTKRQLWVTALDLNAEPGSDASYPAFWLPGQTTGQDTLLGQWAPNACLGRSATCADSRECCAGLTCNDDGHGKSTCGPVECSTLGQPCEGDDSCCPGADLKCRGDLRGTPVCQP